MMKNSKIDNDLLNVLIRDDKRLERRELKEGRAVNIYRIAHYLAGLNRIRSYVDSGQDLRLAIMNCFLGSLANKLIKKAKLEPMNRDELAGWGYKKLPELDLTSEKQ